MCVRVRLADSCARERLRRAQADRSIETNGGLFLHLSAGELFALERGMIWFFEREQDFIVCEVRKTADDSAYEFEVAASNGAPAVRHFDSPHDLIEAYIKEQKRLLADGWHPTMELAAE